MPETLSNAQTIALAAAVKAKVLKSAKTNLTPGTVNVDNTFTVNVQGTVTKGVDYEQTPAHRLPKTALLAFMVKRAGCTRESAMEWLTEFFSAALATEGKLGDLLSEIETMDSWIREVQGKVYANLPKQTMSGKVTSKIDIEIEVA